MRECRSRKRIVLTCAFLVLGSVLLGAGKSAELWKSMAGKPNPRLLDNFELIEGVPLVKTEHGIAPEAAALSALLSYQISRQWAGDAEDPFFVSASFRLMQMLCDAAWREHGVRVPKEKAGEMREWLNAKLSRPAARVKEVQEILARDKEGEPKCKTQGVKNALYMQQYVDDRRTLREAVELFAEEEYLQVTIESEDEAAFDTIQEAVHKQIPVLLKDDAAWSLCVGYLIVNGKSHVVVYHPALSEYEKKTGYELSSPVDRRSKDPWVQKAMEWRKKQIHFRDRVLALSGELPPGVEIVEWQAGHAEALYIYGWQVDLDKMLDEFLGKLGN